MTLNNNNSNNNYAPNLTQKLTKYTNDNDQFYDRKETKYRNVQPSVQSQTSSNSNYNDDTQSQQTEVSILHKLKYKQDMRHNITQKLYEKPKPMNYQELAKIKPKSIGNFTNRSQTSQNSNDIESNSIQNNNNNNNKTYYITKNHVIPLLNNNNKSYNTQYSQDSIPLTDSLSLNSTLTTPTTSNPNDNPIRKTFKNQFNTYDNNFQKKKIATTQNNKESESNNLDIFKKHKIRNVVPREGGNLIFSFLSYSLVYIDISFTRFLFIGKERISTEREEIHKG
jgi:hypothetical protein